MRTLLQFTSRIAPVLYILLAFGIFFSIRSLFQAYNARRKAVFGLEREAARQQRRNSLGAIITFLVMAGAIYIIDDIVVPNLGETPEEPTPTPMVFVTQMPTGTPSLLLFPTITPTVGLPPAEEAELPSEPVDEVVDACAIIGSTITLPEPGQAVSGANVRVEGEANILNFSQYKFEINGPSTNGAWVVVGTYVTPVATNALLGVWDATSLLPGNYTFRLVVLAEDGSYPTPCEVPIVILKPDAAP
ncbi:MAG: hypothetical protein JXJ17_15595 [Anaerolineae bacterium]|nr:hypothetical protein [Anaerolineae bacterium]